MQNCITHVSIQISIILPLLPALRKSVPMELNGLSQMRKEVFRVVTSGIKVELVRNFLGQQLLMHLLSRGCESVFILLSTIDVDCLSSELRLVLARQKKRIVLVPVCEVNWIAKYSAKQLGKRTCVTQIGIQFGRGFCHKRRALGADRAEKFRMRKGKTQRSISAHGEASDTSRLAFAIYTIFGFDEG